MLQFTKKDSLMDVLTQAPQSEALFVSIGMHCLGCIMASGENIEEACMVHGVDADKFVEVLNEYVNQEQEVPV